MRPGRVTRWNSAFRRLLTTSRFKLFTFHQLGRVAHEQRQYAEASYRKALDIYLQIDDQQETARTYHNLGTLAMDRGQYADADACLRKALGIYQEFDFRTAAFTATLLSSILTELGHHDEAGPVQPAGVPMA